jgi:hypothetical protein
MWWALRLCSIPNAVEEMSESGGDEQQMEHEPRYVEFRREATLWAVLIGGGFFGLYFLIFIFYFTYISVDRWLIQIARAHYAAAIGLPLMAIAALLIVSTFRITAGELDFELFGMRLKGAAGPVVLWVIVFLAMVLGVWTLWGNTC